MRSSDGRLLIVSHTQPCRVSRLSQFDQWQLKNRGRGHHEKTRRVKGKIMWVRVLTSFRGCDVFELWWCENCSLWDVIVPCVIVKTVNLHGQWETESLWLLWSWSICESIQCSNASGVMSVNSLSTDLSVTCAFIDVLNVLYWSSSPLSPLVPHFLFYCDLFCLLCWGGFMYQVKIV